MNIRDLKELIKDLPDEMPVVEACSGPMDFGVASLALKVGTIYCINWENQKGQIEKREYSDKLWITPTGEYQALIYNTEY